jgi:type 1 glutamine amidotransferase
MNFLATIVTTAAMMTGPADTTDDAPHIVFVTGDEEYRSEESMPMLAKILHRDYGFEVTVCYSLGEDGTIDPNNTGSISGLEALADADMMVMFTRFRALPDDQLKMITDFAESGRPMAGFRTATHAFRYPGEHERAAAMNDDWPIRVFGQKWITHHGHHGDNDTRLTKVTVAADVSEHPILRGVQPFEAYSWLYHVHGGGDVLSGDSKPLMLGRSMISGHERAGRTERFPLVQPVAWTKTYTGASGQASRVFFTTLGHPFDFKEPDMRRLALNGILWALGAEDRIPSDGAKTDTVGEYDPAPSGFGKVYKAGVTPETID